MSCWLDLPVETGVVGLVLKELRCSGKLYLANGVDRTESRQKGLVTVQSYNADGDSVTADIDKNCNYDDASDLPVSLIL